MADVEKTVTQVRLKNSQALLATNEALEQVQKTADEMPMKMQALDQKLENMQSLNTSIQKISRDTDLKVDCMWEHLQLPPLSEKRQ